MMLLLDWLGGVWLHDDKRLMGPFSSFYSACKYYNHSLGMYPDFPRALYGVSK